MLARIVIASLCSISSVSLSQAEAQVSFFSTQRTVSHSASIPDWTPNHQLLNSEVSTSTGLWVEQSNTSSPTIDIGGTQNTTIGGANLASGVLGAGVWPRFADGIPTRVDNGTASAYLGVGISGAGSVALEARLLVQQQTTPGPDFDPDDWVGSTSATVLLVLYSYPWYEAVAEYYINLNSSTTTTSDEILISEVFDLPAYTYDWMLDISVNAATTYIYTGTDGLEQAFGASASLEFTLSSAPLERSIPEPASAAMLLVAVGCMGVLRRGATPRE